ncbi:alpha/beta hydrolase [Stakelama saccharophila]|uniref:Alpha/beta hydrolase n=1 Tax=Stakelama saccharophila TaxID=3075605 RepID=A0ABZ0B7X7_9SPHN|nr:alpha/beta hydrolase [Stakelama sp. W311]WNO53327.1 alpha/beta hydrolase [Stakelama sp. W311]
MADSAALARSIPDDARITRWRGPGGGDLRRFDRPAAGAACGAILFQGGRGDFAEKYLESFAYWHRAGWHVTSFDWRGQGGSGRFGASRGGDIDDFATYVADLRAFWADWQAQAPGPHVIVGHSMGGHIVLRALAEGAVTPAAAVLVAPMLGLRSPLGARLGEAVARWMTRLGDPGRRAWKGNEKPATTDTRESLLTHDHRRYLDEIWWQRHDPDLLLGPPSWRWLHEAFRSTRTLRESDSLARVGTPVLALVAEADGLVDPVVAKRMLARLPDHRTVCFGRESAHEILREADPVRDRALAVIDRFLAERVASS